MGSNPTAAIISLPELNCAVNLNPIAAIRNIKWDSSLDFTRTTVQTVVQYYSGTFGLYMDSASSVV